MALSIQINVNENLYLRDPQRSDVGQRMLHEGIVLLDELGLEAFTFRKLSQQVGCTEATVYRYFSSKHQLLLYLVSWYWDWVHHLILQATIHELDVRIRLQKAVEALTHPMVSNPDVPYIDEQILHRVVLREGTKAYHTVETDHENEKNIFLPYKSLTAEIARLILAVNPEFPYPRALASSLFEMAHNHIYFAQHLPRLTDIKSGDNARADLESMLHFWVSRLLGKKQHAAH